MTNPSEEQKKLDLVKRLGKELETRSGEQEKLDLVRRLEKELKKQPEPLSDKDQKILTALKRQAEDLELCVEEHPLKGWCGAVEDQDGVLHDTVTIQVGEAMMVMTRDNFVEWVVALLGQERPTRPKLNYTARQLVLNEFGDDVEHVKDVLHKRLPGGYTEFAGFWRETKTGKTWGVTYQVHNTGGLDVDSAKGPYEVETEHLEKPAQKE